MFLFFIFTEQKYGTGFKITKFIYIKGVLQTMLFKP